MDLARSTRRLTIRNLLPLDYPEWKRALLLLGPPKNKWDWGDLKAESLTRVKFKRYIQNPKVISISDEIWLGVFEKKTSQLAGLIVFRHVIRGPYQSAEIGWQLFHTYWGKGYGKEMTQGALKIAFSQLSLHRVEALISPGNKRSIKLACSVGMRKEGLSKNRLNFGSGWKDMFVYAITKSDKSKS